MSQEVSPDELEKHLKSRDRMTRRAVARGVKSAAQAGRTYMVQVTNTRGKVYTGQFKASWRVQKNSAAIGTKARAARAVAGVELVNSAPHAGIVELGARPHSVNREGIENLTLWARRVLGLSPEEARSAAFAIAAKFRREGQKPTFMVRDSLPKLRVILGKEVDREIIKASRQPSDKDLRRGKG